MRRQSILALYTVAFACLVMGQLVGLSASARADEREAAVDRQVATELEKNMFLGTVVCAGRPGKILFLKAYGERDKGSPMQTNSIFDVASLTKPVTVGTSLAITLSRRPEISLDDPISKYLPKLTGKGGDTMTIRQVARHFSGLDNTKKLAAAFEGEELLQEILSRDVTWPADSRYAYSCLGMIRLSEMVAKIHDKEFGAFCQENIFEPLGMRDTMFGPAPAALRERCVRMLKQPGVIMDQNASKIGRPVGNAGLLTTAEDLAKIATLWLQKGEYEGKRLFSAEVAEKMTQGGIVWKRGAGGNIPNQLSANTYSHTGHTGQTFMLDPERNAYVVVLTNWRHASVTVENEVSDLARKRIAVVVIEQYLSEK